MRLIKNRKARSGNLGKIALGQMKNVKIILHFSSDLEPFSPNYSLAHAIISTNSIKHKSKSLPKHIAFLYEGRGRRATSDGRTSGVGTGDSWTSISGISF